MAHIDAINPRSIDNSRAPMDVIFQVLIPKINELAAAASTPDDDTSPDEAPAPSASHEPVTVVFASEAAQDLAVESGVDLTLIEPRGVTGATKADVQRAIDKSADGAPDED